MASEGGKLTPKQTAFVRAYLETGNASEVAERLGIVLDPAPPKVGCYVYLLLCPLGANIIYVGKGIRSRMLHHERDVLAGRMTAARKCAAIRKHLDAGQHIRPVVFHSGMTDKQALQLERQMIAAIGAERLANSAAGNRHPDEVALEDVELTISRLLPHDEWRRRRNPTPAQEAMAERVRSELLEMREYIRQGWPVNSLMISKPLSISLK